MGRKREKEREDGGERRRVHCIRTGRNLLNWKKYAYFKFHLRFIFDTNENIKIG